MSAPFVSLGVCSFLLSSYWLFCHNDGSPWCLFINVVALFLRECLGNSASVSELECLCVYACVFTCELTRMSLCILVVAFPLSLHCLGACECVCVSVYVCVPVGVAREPQFLYGPICFVLFVLLINEIRGAACWDGPTAPPHRTGPLSHGWLCFPNECLLFLSVLSHLYTYASTGLTFFFFPKFIYALIFVFQFVTLVDTPRPARWLLVVD